MKKFTLFFVNLSNKNFILSRSAIVITASMISNVFAYLFQLLAGRYLSIEDYGKLTSLFSLSGIIPLSIGIFLGALPKLVAEIREDNYPNRISKLFFTLLYFSTASFIFVTISLFVFQQQIADYLNIRELDLIRMFALAVGTGILTYFLAPFLQGLMRFKAFSFVTILTASLKLGVVLAVIYLTLGVKDIFTGLAITTFIVGAISVWTLKKNLKLKFDNLDWSDFRTLTKYSLFSSLGLVGLNIMQNIDLIVAKNLFDEMTAGLYGSTTVTGKIIFYAASPVSIVMLPICSEKFKKGQNFVKPFIASLGIALFICISGSLVYTFAPELTIKLLFGEKYLGVIEYLSLYSIYMLFYTLMNFLALFLISISRFRLSSLPLFAAIVQYFSIQFFATSIHDIIIFSIVACLAATIPLLVFVSQILVSNKHTQD